MSDEFSVLRNFQRASDDPRATAEHEHRMNRVRKREAERDLIASEARVTEATMIAALRQRYGQRSGNGPHWALIPHVRNGAGWGGATGLGGLRTCDALALSLWSSKGFALYGHEIKCSRSDWLTELKDPSKADAFARYCARWFLVAGPGVVRSIAEIPEGWGLMELKGDQLVTRRQAVEREPEPLPRGLVVAMVRAAIRAGSLGGEQREVIA
jgi:hypothetical protein